MADPAWMIFVNLNFLPTLDWKKEKKDNTFYFQFSKKKKKKTLIRSTEFELEHVNLVNLKTERKTKLSKDAEITGTHYLPHKTTLDSADEKQMYSNWPRDHVIHK